MSLGGLDTSRIRLSRRLDSIARSQCPTQEFPGGRVGGIKSDRTLEMFGCYFRMVGEISIPQTEAQECCFTAFGEEFFQLLGQIAHERQKAGVSSTSKVKISSRPKTMARHSRYFAIGEMAA